MSDKNLRNKLIRLAYQKPELRGDILPLLKTASYDEVYKAAKAFAKKCDEGGGFSDNSDKKKGIVFIEWDAGVKEAKEIFNKKDEPQDYKDAEGDFKQYSKQTTKDMGKALSKYKNVIKKQRIGYEESGVWFLEIELSK